MTRAASVCTDNVEFEFSGDDAPHHTRRPDGHATLVVPEYVALAFAADLEAGSPLYVGGYRYRLVTSAVGRKGGDHSYVLSPLVE